MDAAARAKLEEATLFHDPDVPGLTTVKVGVRNNVRLGDEVYSLLENGCLFIAHMRGDQMVGFTFHDADEVAELRSVLGG